jgi:drug/metabolite transporter (DMT)-like permease
VVTSTLFATIFAILLLGEKPSPLIGIGVLLVTIGIIFITKSK